MGFIGKIRNARLQKRVNGVQPIIRAVLGAQKLVCLDVGAAFGLIPHWRTLEQTGSFILVEPTPETRELLKKQYPSANFKIVGDAVTERGGKRTLYVTHVTTGSSLLKPDVDLVVEYCGEDYVHPMREVEIETRNLSVVLDEINEPRIDLMKLDIQGAELEVLRGAESRMQHVLGAELEVGMPGGYHDQPKFGEIDTFMKKHGLELFDLRVLRHHRIRNEKTDYYQRKVFSVFGEVPTISARIWEVDAVWFRSPALLLAQKDAAALRRMITIYCTYCFFTDAWRLVETALELKILKSEEAESLKTGIVSWHRSLHYRFWHSPHPFFGLVRKVLYKLSPRSAPHWAQYMYYAYPSG